jgi:hypothetical protein
MPIIPVTQEMEIGGWWFKDGMGKRTGQYLPSKLEALTSPLSTAKTKRHIIASVSKDAEKQKFSDIACENVKLIQLLGKQSDSSSKA